MPAFDAPSIAPPWKRALHFYAHFNLFLTLPYSDVGLQSFPYSTQDITTSCSIIVSVRQPKLRGPPLSSPVLILSSASDRVSPPLPTLRGTADRRPGLLWHSPCSPPGDGGVPLLAPRGPLDFGLPASPPGSPEVSFYTNYPP